MAENFENFENHHANTWTNQCSSGKCTMMALRHSLNAMMMSPMERGKTHARGFTRCERMVPAKEITYTTIMAMKSSNAT